MKHSAHIQKKEWWCHERFECWGRAAATSFRRSWKRMGWMFSIVTNYSRAGNVVAAIFPQASTTSACHYTVSYANWAAWHCWEAEALLLATPPCLCYYIHSSPSDPIMLPLYLLPNLAHTWLHNNSIHLTAAAEKQAGKTQVCCHSSELDQFTMWLTKCQS